MCPLRRGMLGQFRVHGEWVASTEGSNHVQTITFQPNHQMANCGKSCNTACGGNPSGSDSSTFSFAFYLSMIALAGFGYMGYQNYLDAAKAAGGQGQDYSQIPGGL